MTDRKTDRQEDGQTDSVLFQRAPGSGGENSGGVDDLWTEALNLAGGDPDEFNTFFVVRHGASEVRHFNQLVSVFGEHLSIFFHFTFVAIFRSFDQNQQWHVRFQKCVRNVIDHSLVE